MKYKGLSSKKVEELQEKYGKNVLTEVKKDPLIIKIIKIICEPMFLLLIVWRQLERQDMEGFILDMEI